MIKKENKKIRKISKVTEYAALTEVISFISLSPLLIHLDNVLTFTI